ncbi:MAG: hypothetical protein RR696_08040, partial [Clostridia bacterium]
MSEQRDKEFVQSAVDACFSDLKGDPWLAQRIMNGADKERKVKKKLSAGLILAIVLILIVATALAVGLSNYFGGFAELESTYGEYEQWPESAKVQLVQFMKDNGVLSESDVSQWTNELGQSEKEIMADAILAEYFSDMTYVDTYNAMARELGPIEKWSDEERVLYTSLLEKHGKLTTSWPVYQIPKGGDLTREEAVAHARDAVLNMFSISEEELDSMGTDAIFSEDAYNTYGAPKDEPFWIVEFGYGMAYRVYMTRSGEMLGIMGPQTQLIAWGRNIMDGSTEAIPGEHDATREQAVQNARSTLTEIINLSYEDADALDATAHFLYSDLYCCGEEPVWLVNWSSQGEDRWQTLLGYDASYMDVEPAGKIFDQVLRIEPSLSDLCASRYEEMGIPNPYTGKNYFYGWSIEDKAAFYEAFADFVNEYAAKHPYFTGEGCGEWEWTRNVSGLPDEKAISQDAARQLAMESTQ